MAGSARGWVWVRVGEADTGAWLTRRAGAAPPPTFCPPPTHPPTPHPTHTRTRTHHTHTLAGGATPWTLPPQPGASYRRSWPPRTGTRSCELRATLLTPLCATGSCERIRRRGAGGICCLRRREGPALQRRLCSTRPGLSFFFFSSARPWLGPGRGVLSCAEPSGSSHRFSAWPWRRHVLPEGPRGTQHPAAAGLRAAARGGRRLGSAAQLDGSAGSRVALGWLAARRQAGCPPSHA